MSARTTRREFLRSSGQLVAIAAAMPLNSQRMGAAAQSASPQQMRKQGTIARWVTDDKLRFTSMDPIHWEAASAIAPEKTILLNPEKTFQEILGFGAAFTDAACFTFSQLSMAAREQLFHELFHPSEMNLNVCRTCIGASDYSTKVYSYDEGDPDPMLQRFSIEHDREYILPILRQARKVNPDLFLFSSAWSPPGWMKSGNSMLGGSMRRRYLPVYAQYLLKFLQAYKSEGVPIQAVTVQNEVDTDQDGRMPACIWPQEYEIEFVGSHLGPLLEQSEVKTKIWILDHNYNLWGRAIAELDDPALHRYCNAVAWHGYAGTPEMMSRVHAAHLDAEMYWTEGGSDYVSPDYLTDWAKWGQTLTETLSNWCRSITAWNLALDERGQPNIGPFQCGGFVTIDSHSREITRSGQCWAFSHFARAIHRGARRFESESTLPGISHAGFENPDGTRVLVVTNPGPAQVTSLQMGAMKAELALNKNSIATLVWS